MLIKILLEIEELCLQIWRCPKERPIQALSSYRADQPFNERMRQRDIGYCLDFRYVQDAQIGLPLLKPIQRIVIRADVLGWRLSSNRSIEHSTKRQPVDDATLNTKADYPTCELVHHNENPIGSQYGRFTSKQINTP